MNDCDWHALTHDSTVTLPASTLRSSVREDTESLPRRSMLVQKKL